MPVSSPSTTSSRQWDATHASVVGLQNPDLQSSPLAHPLPRLHFSPQAPPQSLSVSSPSLRPSSHAVALQRCDCMLHIPVEQSPSAAQAWPASHFFAQPPPQSLSVSPPFLVASSQYVATHTLVVALQNPERQSSAIRQPRPSTHFVVHAPPQSMSVSELSFWLFAQSSGGPRSSI